MFHNDVLRRIRYALAINDTAAISIFKLMDYEMDIDYLHSIMKKEDEEGYLPCRDKILAMFLDGLIIKNRGKQEGLAPKELGPKERLSNNEILRKIRIAMSYKDEDMIAILYMADFRLSKGELSALFRKPDHRNYKAAGDQVVRNLLQGMVIKYRQNTKPRTSNQNAFASKSKGGVTAKSSSSETQKAGPKTLNLKNSGAKKQTVKKKSNTYRVDNKPTDSARSKG